MTRDSLARILSDSHALDDLREAIRRQPIDVLSPDTHEACSGGCEECTDAAYVKRAQLHQRSRIR